MKKSIAILLSILMVFAVLPVGIIGASAESTVIDLTPAYTSAVRDNVPSNWWSNGVNYISVIQLHNGSALETNALLTTFEQHCSGLSTVGYPIWRSNDLGHNWEQIAMVVDPVNNSATQEAEFQPTLFELPEDLGNLKKGTILLAGCSSDGAHTTNTLIQLYCSTDGGYNWSHLSTVATGGGMGDNTNPSTGVWEPNLQFVNGELICYYSDETDKENHSQKIVYKTSKDGINWSASTDVVATENSADRPGMPVVTKLGNGTYFMAYEYNEGSGNDYCRIYYKTSVDGKNWGDVTDKGTKIPSTYISDTSEVKLAFGSAPYCAWTPYGGTNGTLFLAASNMGNNDDIDTTYYLVSNDNGETWQAVAQPIPFDDDVKFSGYHSGLTFSADGKILYAMNNPVDESVTPDEGRLPRTKVMFAAVELEQGALSLENNQYGLRTADALIENVTDYTQNDVSYSEDFNSSTTVPMTMHSNHGNQEVVDGKWHIKSDSTVHENWSQIGLTDIRTRDFAVSLELKMATQWGDCKYIYHAATGWPNSANSYNNFDSYFNFVSKSGKYFELSLVNKGEKVISDEQFKINTEYNVVLISKGAKAEIYVWEKGTVAPNSPTLSLTSSAAGVGDFHISTYDANNYIDNIKIYEPSLTEDDLSVLTGENITEENAVYKNNLSSGIVPVAMSANTQTNEIRHGKWAFNTTLSQTSYSTNGLTSKKLDDFVFAFEFTRKKNDGSRSFYFHTNQGSNPNSNPLGYLQVTYGGKVILKNNETSKTSDEVVIENGKTYNIVIKSVGTTASAYVWEKGTNMPTAPTVTATSTTAASGDIYFNFYANSVDYLDNFAVYELPLSAGALSDLTGAALSDDYLLYENRFNSSDDLPEITSSKTFPTNEVSNGVWKVATAKGDFYTSGIAGKQLNEFVFAFDFARSNQWGTRQVIFHQKNASESKTDGTNNIFMITGTELRIYGQSSPDPIKVSLTLASNKTYSVVLACVNGNIDAYVWEKGTNMPTAPALSADIVNYAIGDIFIKDYIDHDTAYDTFDNIVLYELPLTTSDISNLTSESFDDSNLVFDDNFNKSSNPPVESFDDFSDATSIIEKKQWKITAPNGKEFGHPDGLTSSIIGDFVTSFEFKTNSQWGNIQFAYHANNGWPGKYDSYLKLGRSTTDNTKYEAILVNNGVSVTGNKLIVPGVTYNVVLKSVGNTASAYIWALNEAVPTEPTVSATASGSFAGDFYAYTYTGGNAYTIDNLKVFNLDDASPALEYNGASLRSAFVSGINFEFECLNNMNMTVVEQGALVTVDGVTKKFSSSNAALSFAVVATGMSQDDTVSVQGYIKLKDSRDYTFTLYSDTNEIVVADYNYKKASYGDANNDGKANILDLVRMKKALANSEVTVNSENIEFDGIDGCSANDLAMMVQLLLRGVEDLTPNNINYVKF